MGTIKKIEADHLYNEIEHAATVAAPLFRMYGWTYGTDNHIPTHGELVRTITGLVEHSLAEFNAAKTRPSSVETGTGRFIVRVYDGMDSVSVSISIELKERVWFKQSSR